MATTQATSEAHAAWDRASLARGEVLINELRPLGEETASEARIRGEIDVFCLFAQRTPH